ncbi:MAG: Uma2 family endonuclease, partial [Acetatifactor sp.]|nr:Uma2 family endonuclease [Acetatifactor sp.]
YWIVSPQGKSVEIYYLQDGKYILEQSYILQEDKEDDEYNAEIALKAFPHIKMTLGEIFEGITE